jgi:hypothetical protein
MMDTERQSVGRIVPPDFLDGIATSLQPEKRLMLALLEGAVSDFQKYATALGGRGRRLFTEASAWLESTTEQPLDFESICQALALDPSFIRAGLRRWCIARRREPSPSKTVLHFPFRRMSGTRHTISAMS